MFYDGGTEVTVKNSYGIDNKGGTDNVSGVIGHGIVQEDFERHKRNTKDLRPYAL